MRQSIAKSYEAKTHEGAAEEVSENVNLPRWALTASTKAETSGRRLEQLEPLADKKLRR